jgi:hypothetical protein
MAATDEARRARRDRESPAVVTVVTGFLGAGNTTLVNRRLAHVARGDVAVIVNEIGAVGIDNELLAARARELVEITGGCVCCTTHAVAGGRAAAFGLDGVVTVVDASRITPAGDAAPDVSTRIRPSPRATRSSSTRTSSCCAGSSASSLSTTTPSATTRDWAT